MLSPSRRPGGRAGASHREWWRLLLPLLVLAGLPSVAGAQWEERSSQEPVVAVPGKAFLLSAALPGTGHHLAGHRRWAGYLAADALVWVAFAESRRTGSSLAQAYRDVAWVVARGRIAPRRDGEWQYYEDLLKYNASGALDVDPGRPGVQPETDPNTHNGALWALARQLFFPSGSGEGEGEAFRRALDYYLKRGVPSEFAWDWRENTEARATYARLIRASDQERQRSVGFAGVLLANRVLSIVDLYMISRAPSALPAEFELQASWDPVSARPWILLRIPTP
jgi:hypothetical protein